MSRGTTSGQCKYQRLDPGAFPVLSSFLLLLAPALARRHSARAVLPVLSPSKKGRRNKAEENLDACVCRAETPSEIPSQGLAFFVTDLNNIIRF
jgi:hypothetical protein